MTTKQLMEVRRLHAEGLSNKEISNAFGVPYGQVGYYLRLEGKKSNPRKLLPRKEYIVHNAHTDEFLAMGSARECAAALGLTLGTFYSEVSRVAHGRRSKYEINKIDAEMN